MIPEPTFGQLLGLGKSWRVAELRFEPESSTFFLKVEETPDLWPEESARAGTPVVCHDHVEPMQWRHLDVFNKECVIVCALPRGRWGYDSKVYPSDPALGGTQQALHARQGCLGLEGFCCGIAASQPASQGYPIRGHRHERCLHQGGE